ncbi:response regulator transcription factor [Chengkuizengella axinellae]|uniref:Heme response regulator HssR n=1 Tax=Chengkuizengella axinellae TaxID=3064388 RepID=A0ABT9IZU5_9BACL|nr:response regulator transcription factor [Chengkuizengella sp. 2205SS18-9]MDP5274882.1 response regulator transcription factor [Chengkuizengella sp. 2205SS18-9]
MINILVADDDESIRHLISLYLSNEGYTILEANDGKEALNVLEKGKINLAIIDIMMPRIDGWELCKEIRDLYEIPVLMVTAKGTTEDKVKGFELGTDDYLVKPFDPKELVVRVKALLRRYNVMNSQIIKIGDIEMDAKAKKVFIKGESLTMPLKEFEVLFQLANYPNQIFTRDQLIEQIWGLDYQGDDRTVDVHIKRLRQRMKEKTDMIKISTIRGLGYRLEVVS